MFSIDRLVVRYGSTTVLNDLSLDLDPGQVHGLVGRNGEGKTTLLDAIFGFVHPTSGSIRYQGEPARPTALGYLRAHNYFYPKLTGREYLRIFQSKHASFDLESWGRIFDLPLDRLVDRYSTGMQKKLAFLGVLSLDRPVLMLDEPFNGLDLETNHILGKLLRTLAENGKTLILTSHVLESLTRTCDQIHLLASGTVTRSFRQSEFGDLDDLLLSGVAGERLALAHQLLANVAGRGA